MRLVRTLVVASVLALATAGVVYAMGSVATLKVEKTKIGKVVANSKLHTLYMFRKDKGTTSECYGACAKTWPPLITTGKPKAGPGIKASLIGTTKRKDGKLQVTYKKHPLYTYIVDKKPGQTTGEGSKLFGAGWYALTPTGIVIDRD
jgi:predicted lipoprotein with Yx(FWY)xxD motif